MKTGLLFGQAEYSLSEVLFLVPRYVCGTGLNKPLKYPFCELAIYSDFGYL